MAKLPTVAIIAIQARLREVNAEQVELSDLLKDQGVDPTELGEGPPVPLKGMSPEQRKALSKKMKKMHAAKKKAAEAAGEGADNPTPAAVEDPTPAPAAPAAPLSFNPTQATTPTT